MKIEVNTTFNQGALFWTPGWRVGVKGAEREPVKVKVYGIGVYQSCWNEKVGAGYEVSYHCIPVDHEKYSLEWDYMENEAESGAYNTLPVPVMEYMAFKTKQECRIYIDTEIPF